MLLPNCSVPLLLLVQYSSTWQGVFAYPQCTLEGYCHLLKMAFCTLLQVSVSVYSSIDIFYTCLLVQSLELLQR